jgi:hypothetical protein
MAVAKPIRALALVTLFLITFLLYQLLSPRSQPPGGLGDPTDRIAHDPNLDRMSIALPWIAWFLAYSEQLLGSPRAYFIE